MNNNDFKNLNYNEDLGLEDNPEKIYVLLKNAITSEPKLIIEATSEDYEDSEQLFEF